LRLRLRVHFDKSAFRSRAIPAVIYLSGCGSVDDGVNRITQKAVIERFKSKGVATLIVDPFPARRNARPVRRSRQPAKATKGPEYFMRDSNDPLATVKVLKTMPDIDGKHIFLHGHSFGAIGSLTYETIAPA
jgi:dienelactone hydrolase